MSTRKAWKAWYRLIRIARRESGKASMDCILFGTGLVRIDENGEAKRIAPQDYRIARDGSIQVSQ